MSFLAPVLALNARHLLLASAVFSLLALVVALVAQYAILLHPCELCIAQRIPYAAIAVIGLGGYFGIRSPRTLYLLAWLCAALFLLDAGIAAYHTGVEYGVFAAPSACASDSVAGQSIEDMRAALLNAPLVTCAQSMAYILGLSMAAWNALAATGAFFALSFLLLRKKRA